MDRTTARRVYNEFSTEVDMNDPGALLKSADVDRYVENALKPLFDAGKVFKRINVNRRTGVRNTRYAYQGGQKIQDSVNTVLAELPEAMGYTLDANGNAMGTNAPPPISVTNLGQHRYNETRERILDPRTAASIKAAALRAGGISTTNKTSGYTTTLVRAGLSGETRAMRQLVNETDAKYLGGELPSSALADGASPATIAERARAQVERQAKIKDARQAAAADYIRRYPDSPLALEEYARRQKITTREEKKRLLEAERTPGTKEFLAKRFRGFKAHDAAADAHDAYLKAFPKSRSAIEARRAKRKNNVSRVKRGAARTTYIVFNAIRDAILLGVKVLNTIASSVRDVGAHLRKSEFDALKYGLDPTKIASYEAYATLNPHLKDDKGITSRVLGGLVESFSTITKLDEEKLGHIATYLGYKGADDVVSFFTTNQNKPDVLMQALLDGFIKNIARNSDGLRTYTNQEDAISRGIAVANYVEGDFAKYLAAIVWEARQNGTLDSLAKNGVGAELFSEKRMREYRNQTGLMNEGDPNNPKSGTYNQALVNQAELEKLLSRLELAKNELLTRILANSGEIIKWLKDAVMLLAVKWFPQMANRMSEENRAQGEKEMAAAQATIAEKGPAAEQFYAAHTQNGRWKGTQEEFWDQLTQFYANPSKGDYRALGFNSKMDALNAADVHSLFLGSRHFLAKNQEIAKGIQLTKVQKGITRALGINVDGLVLAPYASDQGAVGEWADAKAYMAVLALSAEANRAQAAPYGPSALNPPPGKGSKISPAADAPNGFLTAVTAYYESKPLSSNTGYFAGQLRSRLVKGMKVEDALADIKKAFPNRTEGFFEFLDDFLDSDDTLLALGAESLRNTFAQIGFVESALYGRIPFDQLETNAYGRLESIAAGNKIKQNLMRSYQTAGQPTTVAQTAQAITDSRTLRNNIDQIRAITYKAIDQLTKRDPNIQAIKDDPQNYTVSGTHKSDGRLIIEIKHDGHSYVTEFSRKNNQDWNWDNDLSFPLLDASLVVERK